MLEANDPLTKPSLQPASAHPRRFLYYLVLTAMVCGALVMVVEILGARVIGPFFGVSLFVWTSMITVTLVALAAGYAAGGLLADRRPSPDFMYLIILASGIFVLLIPAAKGLVLRTMQPLGLRAGALSGSAVLFGPPLFLLGCVSPYIVRIAAREMMNIGRTVGVFYAISTMGSFAGTVVTGFFLIAYMGLNQIFSLVGALLVLLSGVYFLVFRRKARYLAALFLLVVPLQAGSVKSKLLENGTRATEVFSKESFYGSLKVLDYSFGSVRTRELLINGEIHGGIDMNTAMSIYDYPYYMEIIPYALNPSGKRCLVMGLGAGLIPMWYEARGITTDVLDIDPDVVRIARKYFGFRNSGDVIVADARQHLNSPGRTYDYIVMDVFSGETTPGHILSVEAFRAIHGRLNEGGILAINLAGSLGSDSLMTASVVKTLQQVFRTVDIYPVFTADNGKDWGNLAIMAYDAAFPPFDPLLARRHHVHPFANSVYENIGRTFRFPEGTPATVLTDDFNPSDVWDVRLREKIREGFLKATDWDFLL